MKTFVICRHAKSDWSQGLPDIQRPLNGRGKKDAPKMGRLLAGYEFMPDLIISSPAERAKTTAQLVAAELSYDLTRIQLDQSIYDDGAGNIISILQDLPDHINTVMIFGHNPTQEGVVRFLTDMGSGLTFPTCAMACMESYASSWASISPNMTTLKWFLIPRLLS